MRRPYKALRLMTFAFATAAAAACRGGGASTKDSALQRDLDLSKRNDSTLMVVSPEERVRLDSLRAHRARNASARTASSTHRAVHRSSAAGEVTTRSSGGETVVKHTKRDAAIGAAAGAVIGGVTHGGKGAVVGGATGGVIGAIIGNNVDK